MRLYTRCRYCRHSHKDNKYIWTELACCYDGKKNRKQLIKIRYIIEINGKEITGNTKIMDSKILES